MEETKLLRPKAEVRMAVLKVIRLWKAGEEDRLWTIRTPRARAILAELLAINPVIARKDQRD